MRATNVFYRGQAGVLQAIELHERFLDGMTGGQCQPDREPGVDRLGVYAFIRVTVNGRTSSVKIYIFMLENGDLVALPEDLHLSNGAYFIRGLQLGADCLYPTVNGQYVRFCGVPQDLTGGMGVKDWQASATHGDEVLAVHLRPTLVYEVEVIPQRPLLPKGPDEKVLSVPQIRRRGRRARHGAVSHALDHVRRTWIRTIQSEHTQDVYDRHVDRFVEWCDGRLGRQTTAEDLATLDLDEIGEDWLRWVGETFDLEGRSRDSHMNGLAHLLAYLSESKQAGAAARPRHVAERMI